MADFRACSFDASAPNMGCQRPRLKVSNQGMMASASATDGAAGAVVPKIPVERQQSYSFKQPGQQKPQKGVALTENQLQVLLPINQYVDYNTRPYTKRQSVDKVTIEHLNARPRVSVVLPDPQLGWRLENNLADDPSAIFLPYSSAHYLDRISQNAAIQLVRQGFGPDNCPLVNGPDLRQFSIRLQDDINSQKPRCRKLPTSHRKGNQFVKISLAYIFLFCIIGVFYISIVHHDD